MTWNLTGQHINGLYQGAWPYAGEVLESRVKYGGAVQHRVRVRVPLQVYGQTREVILVEEFNRILDQQELDYLTANGQ